MDSDKNYVWYASYGSNINRDRFMCYIQGGSPEGSTRVETGCRDTTPPIAESSFHIQYPLYFAKEAPGWQTLGVGFLGLHPDDKDVTFGKIYLVTSEQFLDVVKQENNGLACNIDLDLVKERGSVIFRPKAWYGNVFYLGEKDGYPVYTFTAPWEMTDVALMKPSEAYLTTIIKGLRTDYSNEQIYDYFKNKPGIKENYSDEELADLIFKSR